MRLLCFHLSSNFSARSTTTYAKRFTEPASIAHVGIILGLVAIAALMFVPPDLILTDDDYSGVPAFALSVPRLANGTNPRAKNKAPVHQDTVAGSTLPLTRSRSPQSPSTRLDCYSVLRSSCSLRC